MVSECVPAVDEELVEKVSIGVPELVETVTQDGVTPLSCSDTVVNPQIEDVEDQPYNLLTESFKKGYDTVLELPSK